MSWLLKNNAVRNILFLPIIFTSSLWGFLILLSALVFRGPRWMFGRKKRTARPDVLNDPKLGVHKFTKINGFNIHYVESGDPGKPLMLFLHGFPECWYSWRHQITKFNDRYHCVAIDMRGVGESEGPTARSQYSLDTLTADVRELVTAIGYNSCTLVAHDWGGAVGWAFAARYPEMVDKYIVMNVPHPDRYPEVTLRYPIQVLKSWYIFFFQLPFFPELYLGMGDFKMVADLHLQSIPILSKDDKDERKDFPTTADDREALKFSMSRPGRATTFLNFYRNAFSNVFEETGVVSVPTLMVWGTGDIYLDPKLSEDTEKFCPNLTVRRIEGGDHFIQQHQPEVVNGFMEEFLKK